VNIVQEQEFIDLESKKEIIERKDIKTINFDEDDEIKIVSGTAIQQLIDKELEKILVNIYLKYNKIFSYVFSIK
jgi:hypothetical protein